MLNFDKSLLSHILKNHLTFIYFRFSCFLSFFYFAIVVVALFGILNTLTATPEGLQVIFAWLHPCSMRVLRESFLLNFIVYIDLFWCHIWGCALKWVWIWSEFQKWCGQLNRKVDFFYNRIESKSFYRINYLRTLNVLDIEIKNQLDNR